MLAELIQKGIPEFESFDDIRAQLPIIDAFVEKFGYIFDLIDYLEQRRASTLVWINIQKPEERGMFRFYVHTHGIVRWKRVLVYFVPELHRELAFIEKVWRFLCRSALYSCDLMHTLSRDKDFAVSTGVLVFDEINHLTKLEKPNPSAVDHVQLAIKARLKVLCSRIFDEITVKNMGKLSGSARLAMFMITRVPELSFCLPPDFRSLAYIGDKSVQVLEPFYLPVKPLDQSACLLRRSDSIGHYYHDTQTDSCCCRWAFHSIRPSFLRLFGHSARSFAHYFHSGPQKISLGDEDLAFDTRQAMTAVLGGPWYDDSSLRKSMNVFASILSDLLWQLFYIIDYAAEKPQSDPEMAFIKDRRDRIAENCRPQFFAHLLRSALVMYHGFWDSNRESVTDAESSGEVWTQVCAWVHKRHGSVDKEFVSGVIAILISNILAETTESDDPD